MRILYTIGIYLYTLGIRLAALLGHKKAGLMVKGWKGERVKGKGERCVWFHAASLGEFEQARPVIEAFRERHPDYRILLTFFSPSGYEVRKNYSQTDIVRYLPMDTPHNARKLLDTYRPDIAFFVKYEFWFNYLGELRRRGIPTYIFSSIFRPDQYFFKWYGGWFRKQLKNCFKHLFVQNEESLKLLKSIGIDHCSLAGDTRFDRVHQIAVAAEGNEVVEAWLNTPSPLRGTPPQEGESKVLVCGSTWPPDEALISQFIIHHSSLKIILAPHLIDEEHLKQIEKLFPDSVRYSHCLNVSLSECLSADAANTQTIKQSSNQAIPKVLIIDNIGLLSKLYRYADVAYIGGGFGVGIHNTLEAVAFGKPVLFGPNYRKFQEAHALIACGGGWSHKNFDEFSAHITPLLTDPEAYNKASKACTDYMNKNLGSTAIILKEIENEK